MDVDGSGFVEWDELIGWWKASGETLAARSLSAAAAQPVHTVPREERPRSAFTGKTSADWDVEGEGGEARWLDGGTAEGAETEGVMGGAADEWEEREALRKLFHRCDVDRSGSIDVRNCRL